MTHYIHFGKGTGGPFQTKQVTEFASGFVEAMFFTDTGYEEDGDLEDVCVDDLSEAAWGFIIDFCEVYERHMRDLLTQAYEHDYDESQAGRDLWFTVNGHGVGYWSRGELDIDGLGELLTDRCGRGEVYLYRGDDGKLYVEGYGDVYKEAA